ncbi:MAG: hypothetical protein ACXIUD_09725 [Mongoliitalea sp.]
MVRFEEEGMVIFIPKADVESHRNYLDSIIQVMKMKDTNSGDTGEVDYWMLDLLQNMVQIDTQSLTRRA